MNLLGQRSAGAELRSLSADREHMGGPYTMDVAVKLAKVSAYLDGLRPGGLNQPVIAVVRNSARGLVASSTEVTITPGRTAGWADFVFASPPKLPIGSYYLSLHAGAGNATRLYGANDSLGEYITDTYSDGPAATAAAGTVETTPSIYATYFYAWSAPDVPDLNLARYGFASAQTALGSVAPDPRTRKTAYATWHGTLLDPEPQGASFAIIQRDGPLDDFLGDRVKITHAASGRSVIAYVHRQLDLDLEGDEQISVTRRLYAEMTTLADEKLLVTVEALGPST